MGDKRIGRRVWRNGMPAREDRNFDRQLWGRAPQFTLPGRLPLTHVTEVWKAKEAIFRTELIAKKCDVYRIKLLYFFVLRPAYLRKTGDERTHRVSRFPFAFVLRPEAVPTPYHVYPFDTGAAATGAFKDHADEEISLEDYELEPTHEAAMSFIQWAFGSWEAYYEGRLRAEFRSELAVHECVASGYIDVAEMGVDGSLDHDKRASTVEMAASHNVPLAGNVQLMIIPAQYLEGYDSLWTEIEKIKAKGADVETYNWQANRAPNEFQKDLMRIARDWYRSKGLLS
jgi:hypothetical protein